MFIDYLIQDCFRPHASLEGARLKRRKRETKQKIIFPGMEQNKGFLSANRINHVFESGLPLGNAYQIVPEAYTLFPTIGLDLLWSYSGHSMAYGQSRLVCSIAALLIGRAPVTFSVFLYSLWLNPILSVGRINMMFIDTCLDLRELSCCRCYIKTRKPFLVSSLASKIGFVYHLSF